MVLCVSDLFPVVDPPQSAGRVSALLPVCGPMASHSCLALWERSHRPVCHLNTLPHRCLENQPPSVRMCVCVLQKMLAGIWQMCMCVFMCCSGRHLHHTQTYSLLIMTEPEGQRANNRCGVVMKTFHIIFSLYPSTKCSLTY